MRRTGLSPTDDTRFRDLGLLTLRVAVGGTLAAHGSQKLFGWFGGGGLAGTGAFFDQLGFRPGRTNAVLAGLGEAGGGALLALGLATPGAGGAIAGTMAVAASLHADKGFFAQDGGLEHPAMLGVVASTMALIGPGRYSLDHATGNRVNRPWMRVAALGAALPAAAVVLRRQRAVRASAGAPPADGELADAAAGGGA